MSVALAESCNDFGVIQGDVFGQSRILSVTLPSIRSPTFCITRPVMSAFLRLLVFGLFVTPHLDWHPIQAQSPDGRSSDDRPNVLVIMVDDMGYSDLGCYGSEIETPNLDRLAGGGIRFSQFYNTAKCHSSRVSLLTGQYCIAAGDVSLRHAVTSAEVLRQAGYSTMMTGKWHLKKEPTDFGFDRYFGHLGGACNYFTGNDTFRLNGKPWKVPKQGFYTTTAMVDYSLRFLKQTRQKKPVGSPWYLYVAFNAPHAPLQALPEDYAKYKGRYDVGWDQIREQRIAKQKQLGILDASTKPSPRPQHVPAWQTLTQSRKTFENNRMTALAAMIDRVDQEVGRLVEDLKVNGEFDNTMILFVSDNGACPYDRTSVGIGELPTDGPVTWSDSTGWAWARNSPFRFYKQNQFEGGIGTPAIVHWPAGLKNTPGEVIHQPAHLIDVMPTLAELADADIPKAMTGRTLRPVSGTSLMPLFNGETMHREMPLHFLFHKDRAIRDGDWKAVSFGGEAWELYHLAEDRTERNDLADTYPEKLSSLADRWMEMGRDVLHAPSRYLQEASPAKLPHHHPEWTDFDRDPASGRLGNHRQGRRNSDSDGASSQKGAGIRARKNTTMEVVEKQLKLTFTGPDSGIALNRMTKSQINGAYTLSMRIKSTGTGSGEIFFTTDPKTSLPNGQRIEMAIRHNDVWQDVAIPPNTNQRIHQLRIDISEGPGSAVIEDLQLRDAQGTVVQAWPH